MSKDVINNHDLKRDPSIELARLLGCLIVIGCHTYLPIKVDNLFDKSRLFFGMLFADGVAVFWLIGGAFLFDNTNYKSLLMKTTKKILLPMFLVGLIYLYYASYFIDGNRTLHDLIFNNLELYKNVVKNILMWRNGFPLYGHAWYVYVYMLLILTFPALNGVVIYTNQIHQRKHVLMIGILIFLAINDFSRNQLASFSHYMINGLFAAALITIVGYYLYQSRQVFQKKRYVIIAPAVFLLMNLIREAVQLHRESVGYGDDYSIMYWYSVFGVIAASCLLIFCISLIQNKKATKCNRLICCLASYTFPVYLIHKLIISIIDYLGLRIYLQKTVLTWNSGLTGEAVYMFAIISGVFWSSFLIAFVFRLIYRFASKQIYSKGILSPSSGQKA